jgi:drug/metabolite transporter (DMT)-like permease
MQAVFAEILIYFIYGGVFLLARGTFSLSLFLNPYVWLISFFCFLRHVLLINGVRKASSVVALEFCAFAKPIFASIIMFIFVGEIPTIMKTFGFVIIVISIICFHSLERRYKKIKTCL